MKSSWAKVYEARKASPELSNGELAKALEMPASTFNYQVNQQRERNQYEESIFWESEAGQNFLKRLIVGVLYTFGIKGGIGSVFARADSAASA